MPWLHRSRRNGAGRLLLHGRGFGAGSGVAESRVVVPHLVAAAVVDGVGVQVVGVDVVAFVQDEMSTLLIARGALRPQTLDAAEEKRVEPVFTDLLAGHSRRMAAIGLDA